jgi:PncC family amidohydrolase
LRLALAESCTGGLATHLVSTVPGVSDTLLLGAVTYANSAKTDLAGVPAELIAARGAVSGEVARAMAEGIARRAGAEVGLAATGIAGPGGGSAEKPVGLVYLACASPLGPTAVERHVVPGDRTWIQERAARSLVDLGRRVLAGITASAPD